MSHVTLSDAEPSYYELPPPAEFKRHSSFMPDRPFSLGRALLLVIVAAPVTVALWRLSESTPVARTVVAVAPEAPTQLLETQDVYTEVSDNMLVFENATLAQILTQLQTYGTDRFVIKDPQLGGNLFGGSFHKGPNALAEGLRRLQRMAPIQATRQGNLFIVEYIKPDAK